MYDKGKTQIPIHRSAFNNSPMRFHLKLWLFFFITLCTTNLSINVFVVSGHCLGHQLTLLLNLKESLEFNPEKSRKLVHWNQSDDCCHWNGVTCSKGRVIALDLSEEFISGGLDNSSSLFSLQYLQNFSLAYNDFHSVIPSEFHNLKSLSYLNLSNAGFKGQIPFEISHLTRLVVLDMSTSSTSTHTLKLDNPNITILLRNLTEIKELYLDGVRVFAKGKEWCHALSSLPNLRVLSMSFCGLSGTIDSSLAKLQSLSIIRLKQNNMSCLVPDSLANLSNLSILQLSSCNLTGVFPRSVFHMQALQVLDISDNPELQGALPNFPQHASLHTLKLSNTNFSGPLPDSICNLRELSTLDLSTCQFNGTLPGSISKLNQLVYLDLSFNNFTGPLPSFNMSKNLTYLSLHHNDLRGEIASAHLEGLINLVSIDLGDNSLNGSVPSSLFSLPSLQQLKLPYNQFDGILEEFSKMPSSVLEIVDLSGNLLQGPIPMSFFHLKRLSSLLLPLNKFNGTIELDMLRRLQNLSTLDLSHNNLSIDVTSGIDHHLSPFPNMKSLILASCKLRAFPSFLRNQSQLLFLDLSSNDIEGTIPTWISQLDNLACLNLSNNLLTNWEGSFQNLSSSLVVLDLHSNKLQGPIPIFPKYAVYLDYSSNRFSSTIPPDIGKNIPYLFYLSLSNNSLYGKIHDSFCNISDLQLLDLSHNNFDGIIPKCLTMGNNLRVLKLGGNKLNGHIPDTNSTSCALRFLDLNTNLLGGTIPKSLANCQKIQVLNLGNNMLFDRFPCHLQNIPTLRVLILRSNNLHGPIRCPNTIATWEMLETVDLAFNNFIGELPAALLRTWKAMMRDEDKVNSTFGMYDTHMRMDPLVFKDRMSVMNKHLGMEVAKLMTVEPSSFIELLFSEVYYEDLQSDKISFIVVYKGQQLNLVKMIVFISVDFSSNHFEGPIPEDLMSLKGLNALNLSNNSFSGQIPSTLGNLKYIESLDLSNNSLSGEIPTELASLSFLEVLNLSFNHLAGEIPTGTQIQSFDVSSFEGNEGLCGPPLIQNCSIFSPPAFDGTLNSDNGSFIDWNFLSVELGVIFGFGIVILPLIFLKGWRLTYCKLIDHILFHIFPQLEFTYERHRGQWYRTLRWRPRL